MCAAYTHTYTHGGKKKREEGREGEGRKRKCWKNYKAKTKKNQKEFLRRLKKMEMKTQHTKINRIE